MKNKLKEKMLSGEKTIGSFFELGSGTAMECLALSGLDYVIIDTEHGPFDPLSALEFIRVAKLYDVSPDRIYIEFAGLNHFKDISGG